MKHSLSLLIVLWVAAVVSACAAEIVDTNRTVLASDSTNAAGVKAVTPLVVDRLMPQDRLLYSIEQDPIKATEAEVLAINALNEVYFRVTRGSDTMIPINTSNKTLVQVRQELKEKLDAEYYQDAKVRLDFKERTAGIVGPGGVSSAPNRPAQILFTGQARSSMMMIPPGETKRIFEALIQVGYTEWADIKRVKVTRIVDQATQKTEVQIIDVKAIEKGDRSNNIFLQDGDVVHLPEKAIMFR
jgi:protein involved in polysaccharide export with SLBB domain